MRSFFDSRVRSRIFEISREPPTLVLEVRPLRFLLVTCDISNDIIQHHWQRVPQGTLRGFSGTFRTRRQCHNVILVASDSSLRGLQRENKPCGPRLGARPPASAPTPREDTNLGGKASGPGAKARRGRARAQGHFGSDGNVLASQIQQPPLRYRMPPALHHLDKRFDFFNFLIFPSIISLRTCTLDAGEDVNVQLSL